MQSPDYTAGNPQSRNKSPSLLRMVIVVFIAMSVYAYGSLSRSKAILPGAIVILTLLEVLHFIRKYKELSKLGTACEAAYFLVFVSVCIAVYRSAIEVPRFFLLATIFYRPYYTLYCNRRLALVLGLLILAVVLPITLGMVTGPDSVEPLTGLYASMVAALWLFCSRMGAKVFGFRENP